MTETPENALPETPTPQNPLPEAAPQASKMPSFVAPHLDRLAMQAAEIKNQVAAQGAQAVSQVANKVSDGIEQAKNIIVGPAEAKEQETSFVSMETESDRIKRKNLFYVSAFIGFVWMLFHFTVVFFFGIQLGSAALVGVFLGFGNLVSLVLDIPVSQLQRYFSAKQLFTFAGISMFFAGMIFLKFIYASSLFGSGSGGGQVMSLLESFMDSGTNLLLLIVASGLYGIAKEINDLTTLSYILNNADPSEYSTIISKNNIFSGGGSLLGLVSSGFILAINPTVAVIVLVVFIVVLIGFILNYFDNSERTVDFSAITKLKIIARKPNVENVKDMTKDYAVGYLSKADFAASAKGFKFVFLRPMAPKEPFKLDKMIEETKKEAINIRATLLESPYNFAVLWSASVVLAFGFWDTFASSFLIEYLAKISSPQMAYVLLGIIAIPAFVAQDFFIGLSRRVGILPIVCAGIVASGVSLVMMSVSDSVWMFLGLGLMNSLGYAAGMGISQGMFLDVYNNFYAKKFNLTEIDSNSSASPMKIIQNLANVVGLCLGGLLLAVFGFGGFFVVFGAMLLTGAVASIKFRKLIAAE